MPDPLPEINRILVPTAFSDLSRHAAPYARRFALAMNAQVHVLHVVAPPPPTVDPSYPAGTLPPTPMPPPIPIGRDGIDGFIEENLAGLTPEPIGEVTVGLADSEIVSYAAAHKIDLIVMGTHAHGVVRRIVFGSVSKSVVEAAPCPVLLVPLAAAEAEMCAEA